MLKFGSKGDNGPDFKCTIRLLEDTEILECEFKAHHKGKYLLEQVCKQLNLIEYDYFGLRYVDPMDQRHWLDLAKSILKQVKDLDPILFSFRVKFYPPDPFRLKEEITRYQIYLQLKRDLLHGRLYCSVNEAAVLGALIVQSELGDYDPELHSGNYVSECKLFLKQTELIEEKILEIHQKQLKGQSASQAENTFLKVSCQLDTFGVDPHPVKDHKGNQLYLGINYSGILTFQGSRKTHHFRWPDIQKINYEGKMFIVHLNYNEKKHTVGFKCPTGAACRHVWRCAMEQMLFFTLPTSSDAPSIVSGGGFFSWGSKFKYVGRTEREILEDSSTPQRDEPVIRRTSSLRRKASSVPATPSTPLQPHVGYASLPRSSQSDAGSSSAASRTDAAGSVGGSTVTTATVGGVVIGIGESSTPSQIAGAMVDAGVALLETVTEDQEFRYRSPHVALGMGVSNTLRESSIDQLGGDYYFRDSFDRSSSESQLHENNGYGRYGGEVSGHRMAGSRTSTPIGRNDRSLVNTAVDGRLCVSPGSGQTRKIGNDLTQSRRLAAAATAAPHKFNLLRAFVPSLAFVVIFVALLTVVMLETDCELFGGFRNLPEMISLRYQYYEPFKQYLRNRFSRLF